MVKFWRNPEQRRTLPAPAAHSAQQPVIYRFRDCELDPTRFELKREGVVQPVEPQVLRLLLLLIEHRDRVITRDELFAKIWEGRIVADSALYSRIKSARAAIGDHGTQSTAIRTVNRMGYQFIAPVQVVTQPADSPAAPASAAAEVESLTSAPPVAAAAVPGTRRLWWLSCAIAVVCAVAWGYSGPLHPDAAATSFRPGGQIAAVGVPSIAVLPFTDLSPQQDHGYVVAGLVEELTEQLARMPGLVIVKGRSAVGARDAGLLSHTLGVEHLLEGSVRATPEQLRITARLLDAQGRQIWSRTYERARGDVLAMQRDVATAVAATFISTPDPQALDASTGGTVNPDAYDAYLSARAALVDPDMASAEDYRQARLQLQQAVRLDPDFAVAHAWLALSYVGSDSLPAAYTEELHERASMAARRALELAPEQPWALLAQARILMRERRWAEAEPIFLQLQRESPLMESRWNCLACFYTMVGRVDEAVARFEQATLLDPQLATNVLCAGLARTFAGDPGRFAGTFAEAGSLYGDGTRRLLTRAFVSLAADRAEIRAAFAALSSPPGSFNERMITNLDDAPAALAELRRQDRVTAPNPGQYTAMAAWAAYFGDPQLALHFLERSSADSAASYALWHPVLAEARRLPGFTQVARKFGLVDYWYESGHWPRDCRPAGNRDMRCS